MVITMRKGTPELAIANLVADLEAKGLKTHVSTGQVHTIIGLIGNTTILDERDIRSYEWVEDVHRVSAPYKLVNRDFHNDDTIVDVAGIKIGGNNPIVFMAGPCAIENEKMTMEIAENVHASGADMLRGGAYKPRTSPYSFQGLETEGIKIMTKAREKTGMPIVTELMDADQIDEFIENVDLIQVGARNMQNFALLKKLGKIDKPVMLKRGMSATIEEWLMSAEYIMAGGNKNVILCERGIRTFEKYTRNTLDLSVVPIVKKRTHLPIIIDPSHATGDRNLVEAMSLAAIAAGADGLIIEVHNDPPHAASDGVQSLYFNQFEELVKKGKQIAKVIGRE